jgi:hypothetical protein
MRRQPAQITRQAEPLECRETASLDQRLPAQRFAIYLHRMRPDVQRHTLRNERMERFKEFRGFHRMVLLRSD